MKKQISVETAPAAIGPYSQGIAVENIIYVSGQIALDPVTGQLADGILLQTRQALENLSNVLKGVNLTTDNVVKTTVFLQNFDDFAVMNKVYSEFFTLPYPARSTVEVAKLPLGALVEIECIAHK